MSKKISLPRVEVMKDGRITIEKAVREQEGIEDGSYWTLTLTPVLVPSGTPDEPVGIPRVRMRAEGRMTIPYDLRDKYGIVAKSLWGVEMVEED